MREEKNQTNKAKSKTPPQIIKYLKKKVIQQTNIKA